MKLGWNFTLTEDDYETLHRTGEISTAFGTVRLTKIQGRDNQFFGRVAIEFNDSQAPPRQLLQKWIDAFYDGDGPELERVNEEIRQIQLGRLALARIPEQPEPAV